MLTVSRLEDGAKEIAKTWFAALHPEQHSEQELADYIVGLFKPSVKSSEEELSTAVQKSDRLTAELRIEKDEVDRLERRVSKLREFVHEVRVGLGSLADSE
jgi:hypothetical protein